MNENKREGTFIPCGDALEKMNEINEQELENVSGGSYGVKGMNPLTALYVCPQCNYRFSSVEIYPYPICSCGSRMEKRAL